MCDIVVLITVANQTGRASATMSPDGSSAASFDQLHTPELSSCHPHASVDAAASKEATLMMDGLWQMTSDKQPVCSASVLLQSPYCDPHVGFTTRVFTPVAASSPMPYFAALPPAIYRLDCDHRQAESVNSHPTSEASVTYTMPVPSDAVLVRPRMPLMTGKHETTSSPSGTGASLVLLSPAVHDSCVVGDAAGRQESASSAAGVYGGGFYAPPVHSSSLSPADDPATAAAAAAASFSCCPHCGVGFPAAAMPRNIVYHPTGPSYVIHSFSPTLQPCYSVTVNSVVPPRPPAPAATYTSSTAGNLRLPDGIYQQTSTRPPLSPLPPSASPGFMNAPPSGTGVRVRTARPPPSCANCGRIGHTQLDCKDPTIDTVLNTRTSTPSFSTISMLCMSVNILISLDFLPLKHE